ncbi:hypothetical protein [Desulforhopalus singaporensis]|uniref:YtkA-like n=1 Tax=Desulforhopalus singaporensis TaxID=91360 RepID=A0A1H0UE88_9BACT|nr:hypothetical protein [Desulforhopalus singaporensis]SDP64494.1 hypothetical protein SAMN05660330_03509 [Desulforhopalus singaporensis]
MKRYITYLAILTLCALVFGCKNVDTSSSMKPTTAEIVVDSPVKLDEKGVIGVSGKGFEPGSKVVVLFVTIDGVQSDIGYALDPEPVADAVGTWKSEWSYGRLVKKNLVKEGRYTMSVADEDFNELTSASIVFEK